MLAGVVAATPAPAEAADNPWLERRGAALRSPGCRVRGAVEHHVRVRGLAREADVLELDVNATADDRLVVIRPRRRPDDERRGAGSGARWRRSAPSTRRMTSFPDATPSRDSSRPPIRCVGCGRGTSVRRGFRPSDFRIPTLREVLRQFPGVPINIEIKGDSARHCTRPRCWRWSCCAPRAWTWWSSRSTKPRSTHFTPPRRADSRGARGGGHGELHPRWRVTGRRGQGVPGAAPVHDQPGYARRRHAKLREPGSCRRLRGPRLASTSRRRTATYARVLDMCADALMTAYPSRFSGASCACAARRRVRQRAGATTAWEEAGAGVHAAPHRDRAARGARPARRRLDRHGVPPRRLVLPRSR